MKILINIFAMYFLGIALAASAQTVTTRKDETSIYHKTIDDDGKTMHITITGRKNQDKPVNFDHKYNVKGMSKLQKDAIKKHIIDSLGIN